MRSSAIGIDLGGTKLLLLCEHAEAIYSTGIGFTPDQLLAHLDNFITQNELTPSSIGLAVPGLVNASGDIVLSDVLPAFNGWQATQALQPWCNTIAVLNDIKAALIQEFSHASKDITAGVVMVGTAIGAALMVQGQPLTGTCGWAGELGYLPIVQHDQIRRLDDLASGAALVKASGLQPKDLALRAHANDRQVLDMIQTAGAALGLGLASVIHLFNPSKLSLGGGTLQLPGYWEAALQSAQENTLPMLWQACELNRIKNAAHVVALGAIHAGLDYSQNRS